MPQLHKNNEDEKIYLPSTKHLPENKKAWVIIDKYIRMGDLDEIDIQSLTNNDVESSLMVASKVIKDWNYENDKKVKEAITVKNLRYLEAVDFRFITDNIVKKIFGLDKNVKKK